MGRRYESQLGRRVRAVGIAAAVIVGGVMTVVAFAFGRCDAFGGRCPADPPAIFDDDVFGIAAVGAALVVGVPVLLDGDRGRPNWRNALFSAASAGLVVGFVARTSAHG